MSFIAQRVMSVPWFTCTMIPSHLQCIFLCKASYCWQRCANVGGKACRRARATNVSSEPTGTTQTRSWNTIHAPQTGINFMSFAFADLAIVDQQVVCAPVDCASVYGSAKPVFSVSLRLCVPLTPSATSTPQSVIVGATPSAQSTPANTNSADPSCVHGTVVCGAVCACQCASGWKTGTGSEDATWQLTVYCNTTIPANDESGTPSGQASGTGCSSAIACFFLDELPYVLVRNVRAHSTHTLLVPVG